MRGPITMVLEFEFLIALYAAPMPTQVMFNGRAAGAAGQRFVDINAIAENAASKNMLFFIRNSLSSTVLLFEEYSNIIRDSTN